MDPTTVALLAAGIPAMVAAATFVVGEVMRERARRDERIAHAVDELADALERVVVVESRPRLVRPFQYAALYSRPTSMAAFLVGVVRRRDRAIALWFLRRTDDYSTLGRHDRVRLSAYLLASLRVWPVDRAELVDRARSDAHRAG